MLYGNRWCQSFVLMVIYGDEILTGDNYNFDGGLKMDGNEIKRKVGTELKVSNALGILFLIFIVMFFFCLPWSYGMIKLFELLTGK